MQHLNQIVYQGKMMLDQLIQAPAMKTIKPQYVINHTKVKNKNVRKSHQ